MSYQAICVVRKCRQSHTLPAVAEFEMVDLQLGAGAVDQRIDLAPVEL